jgi:hypothetical protein
MRLCDLKVQDIEPGLKILSKKNLYPKRIGEITRVVSEIHFSQKFCNVYIYVSWDGEPETLLDVVDTFDGYSEVTNEILE